MDRRKFTSLCTALLAGAAGTHANAGANADTNAGATSGGQRIHYPTSRLIYEDDSSVTLASLQTGRAYIFGYPYVTTPCFLMRLSKSAPARGSWPGGVDTDQSVVAFSAICSHKMSHPAKPISHIAYRPEPVDFYDSNGERQTRDGVVSCCSERSVYDPAEGGKVISGPAPVSLAAIALSHDAAGNLSATGSFGPDQYDRFLTKFGFRLAMEYGVTNVRLRAAESIIVVPAEDFSAQQVLC